MQSFLNFTAETKFSEPEAFEVMDLILDQKMDLETSVQILKTIHQRGETVDELTGFLRAIMNQDIHVTLDPSLNVVDTCGTGGDGLNTINVSTGAALLLASMGVNVAKHGGRAATGKVGSADVIESLGIPFAQKEEDVLKQIKENHFSFLFAPDFNPRLKGMSEIRKALADQGSRSCFNMLSPLANPAKPPFQMIGVYSQEVMEKLAELILKLSDRTVLIVNGEGTMDEISITGPTATTMVVCGEVSCMQMKPEDFDIVPYAKQDAMEKLAKGNSVGDKAFLLKEALSSVQNPSSDIICANAAAVMWIMGKADSLGEGMRLAREACTNKLPARLIDKIALKKPN